MDEERRHFNLQRAKFQNTNLLYCSLSPVVKLLSGQAALGRHRKNTGSTEGVYCINYVLLRQ